MIGQIIGARNYDIGHIALGVNGGGIAALGVVGGRFKAQGCTGVPTPEGDLFAIDYVAHEMGHQFGGNHTFNGRRFACGFGNRNQTHLGRARQRLDDHGLRRDLLQDDLQPHSDPYFSQRSIDEIGDYVTSTLEAPPTEVQSVALRGFHTGRGLIHAHLQRRHLGPDRPRHELQRGRDRGGDRGDRGRRRDRRRVRRRRASPTTPASRSPSAAASARATSPSCGSPTPPG